MDTHPDTTIVPPQLARILRLRAEIARGTYATRDKMEVAADRLLDELSEDSHFPA